MKFSIITPSFRNSEWLKLCVASVADQRDIEHEHIVQDAYSDDGTLDWLPSDPRVQAHVEKDGGMYDAINRGIRRSTGDLVAYLNCDEQYLPGALKAVHDHFENHPEVDIVGAHFVVVDGDFHYICHRLAMRPTYPEAWHRFSVSTCAIFCRKRVFTDRALWYDTRWRAVSDWHWMLATLRSGCRWSVLPRFTSVFADHGKNLILTPDSQREVAEFLGGMPVWVRWLKPVLIARYRMRMIATGTFWQRPFDYSVYMPDSRETRETTHIQNPSPIWRGRRS